MNVALSLNALGAYALTRARPLLGSMVEISASSPDTDRTLKAVNAAFAAVAQVHKLMSYHELASDVSRINSSAFYGAVRVHPWTHSVLQRAREISAVSDGLFDISIAPQLSRLGFLPRHQGFPRIVGRSDWRNIELLSDDRVRLTGRLRIDLGGIAKGYAVDRAVEALEAAGATAGHVNAGGDLRLFGTEVQAIHVRKPLDPTGLIALAELREGAVATSAAYYASKRVRGRQVSPHIQALTREAISTTDSVTVVATDCMTADALTKVVLADAARAAPVLERFNARALIVRQDAETGECHIFDSASPVSSGQ